MSINTNPNKINELLTRGVTEIINKPHLEKLLKSGKQLRIKHGVDPTSSDLTLGHAVIYEKLRQFQQLGHKIIFLIGGFTGRFGDPTEKLKSRQLRDKSEIEKLAQNYIKQLSKILDIKKIEIRDNSEWYDKMSAEELLQLMSKFNYARLIERDMFQKRIKKEKKIQLHELVYPILQGYDSIMLKNDATVIGLDQKFNELQARPLQKEIGQDPQDIVMMPILIGTDGKQKMSQSLNNYIGLTEPANEQYGKIMSIPDNLIIQYFELLTRLPQKEINQIKKDLKQNANPRNYKALLAFELVSIYHNKKNAKLAENEFNQVFKQKGKPTIIPKINVSEKTQKLLDLIAQTKFISSKAEARRLIQQNAVKINDKVKNDWQENITVKSNDIIQIGKRKFIKIK